MDRREIWIADRPSYCVADIPSPKEPVRTGEITAYEVRVDVGVAVLEGDLEADPGLPLDVALVQVPALDDDHRPALPSLRTVTPTSGQFRRISSIAAATSAGQRHDQLLSSPATATNSRPS